MRGLSFFGPAENLNRRNASVHGWLVDVFGRGIYFVLPGTFLIGRGDLVVGRGIFFLGQAVLNYKQSVASIFLRVDWIGRSVILKMRDVEILILLDFVKCEIILGS